MTLLTDCNQISILRQAFLVPTLLFTIWPPTMLDMVKNCGQLCQNGVIGQVHAVYRIRVYSFEMWTIGSMQW